MRMTNGEWRRTEVGRGGEGALLAGGLDEGGEGLEERVTGVVQQRVENGLDGQHMHAGVAEGGEAGRGVGGAAGADGVHEDGDLQAKAQRAERGLVDADGRFEAAEEQVLDPGCVEMGGEGLVRKRGESVLGKNGGERGEFAQARVGGAEFGGDLFAENDRDAESVRGGEREAGASANRGGLGGGDGAEEGGLQIHGEQSGPGDGGLGGGRDEGGSFSGTGHDGKGGVSA